MTMGFIDCILIDFTVGIKFLIALGSLLRFRFDGFSVVMEIVN